jgi:hypothetical protein
MFAVQPNKGATAAIQPTVAVVSSSAPEDEAPRGLTAEDLEIDDVHYQMMMWNAFASAWDEIVDDVRQSDLVSDKEVGTGLHWVRL